MFFVDRKPINAEKNTSTEADAHEEGFVLGIMNNPSGTDVAIIPTTGTRRKCLGRAKITDANTKITNAELKNLIDNTDAAKSLLANQLLTQ
jgi:hypothetical protein